MPRPETDALLSGPAAFRTARERAIPALAILGTALRLVLAFRDPIAIDRLFMPDDAYYTLTIARSLAAGHGPSMGGTHLTNGFQPLLAFLLVPFASVRAALVIGAVSDGITAFCLGTLATRLSEGEGRKAGDPRLVGAAAAAVWALSPSAIATSMNGLETSLSVACLAAALLAFEARKPWAGALLGLCLLARVDSVFFVAGIGVATLRRDGMKKAALATGLAAAVVAPWWLYSLARFGTVVPESGAAVREQAMMYRDAGMVVRDQVAWATGAVFGPPFVDSTTLRQLLGSTASGVGMAVGILLVAGAIVYQLRRRPPAAVTILMMHALCIFFFYALYLPATWFFRRYLVPVHLLIALVTALHLPKRRAWVASLAWPLVALLGFAPFFFARPEMTPDQGHHGAKGYLAPARAILAHAPPRAVIGSLQSGALSWLSADGKREGADQPQILNLDGVVDGEARAAIRDRRLAEFARSRGMTHLADWDLNVKRFEERAGPNPPKLTRLYEAEPQGAHERFILYEVTWPEPR